jgi:hypothetical protein
MSTSHNAETTVYSLETLAPGPERRSKDQRHVSLLRVGSLQVDGRRELCLIRNLSSGGMMIRSYSPLSEGTHLTVELKEGEPIDGVVRWKNAECVGISFHQPIDVVELLSVSCAGPRPRLPRVEVGCFAKVRVEDDVYQMRATNISQGGVRLVGDCMPPPNSDAVVTIDGLKPVPGVVRWAGKDACGINFNGSLNLGELVAWLRCQQDEYRAAS